MQKGTNAKIADNNHAAIEPLNVADFSKQMTLGKSTVEKP